eukprot:6488712-Amphidinium_carterae.2
MRCAGAGVEVEKVLGQPGLRCLEGVRPRTCGTKSASLLHIVRIVGLAPLQKLEGEEDQRGS